ncbi:MAG: hypothetical protein Q9M97_09120 [Candidatus Gracilibacteria bacterium]|nr:hypothetical protein [Candidatus Gracilibacteria bacterium]
MNCGEWWRISNAIPPINGSYMVVGGDGCTLNKVKKLNNSQPSSQIMYEVAYKRELSLGEGISNYYYYNYGDNTEYYFSDQTKRVWGDIEYTGNECFNIYTHFCGDGIVDSSNGEQCDDGNNIDGDTCSATCEVETTPVPLCTNLTVNETTGAYACSGTDVTTYRVFVDGNIASTNATGRGTYNITNAGTYNFSCMVDGETIPNEPECVQEVIVEEPEPLLCSAGTTGTQSSAISTTTPNLCSNTGETVINFSFSTSGRTTSYIWNCTDGTETYTGGNCNASYTSGGGGGGGGGGGNTPQCHNIEVSGNEVTCLGNTKSKSFGIICDTVTDGENLTSTVGKFKISEGRILGNEYATFTCATVNEPKCFVYNERRTTYGSKAWRSSSQCIINTTKTCGDGRVDNPNDAGVVEQCDGGVNCKSDCTLKTTNTTPNCGNSVKYYDANPIECGITTRPSGGEIWIYPIGDTLVGGNSVFDFNSVSAKNRIIESGEEGDLKIVNIGDEPFNLTGDKFCIYNNSNIITGLNNGKLCDATNDIGWIYPGQAHYFRKDASVIKGNPDGISSGKDHETTTLVGTLAGYDWAYFAAKMNVTVAKPSIAGQGGGTSYLTDSTKISNINKIVNTVNTNNDSGREVNINQNNFVSTVLGDTDNLSNLETINDTTLAVEESTELENNAEEVVEEIIFVGTKTEINSLSSFASYRGIENVVFVRDTNVTLSAQDLTETKTYIIENGNLIIDGNIESDKNIAFIVKNGDIIIKDTVTRIDGTYVNIGGKIISDNTEKKLTVNGSIYGDLSELTSNRTHMSMDNEGNISVGTIVNYGSNILKKPAPLVGQFINEYTTSTKVAR